MKFSVPILFIAALAVMALVASGQEPKRTPAESAEIQKTIDRAFEEGIDIEDSGFTLEKLKKRAAELKAGNAALQKRIDALEAARMTSSTG